MGKIFIKDLTTNIIIGVNELERTKPQPVIINLSFDHNLKSAGKKDSLEDSISYSSVSDKVLAYAETAHTKTVEALAHGIAELCLKEFNLKEIRVKVEKPLAIKGAVSAGVEIKRSAKKKKK